MRGHFAVVNLPHEYLPFSSITKSFIFFMSIIVVLYLAHLRPHHPHCLLLITIMWIIIEIMQIINKKRRRWLNLSTSTWMTSCWRSFFAWYLMMRYRMINVFCWLFTFAYACLTRLLSFLETHGCSSLSCQLEFSLFFMYEI